MKVKTRWGLRLIGVLLSLLLVDSVAAQAPVVRSVLFYTQTCPACRKVMQEDLPPLVETYGEQLQILAVDVTTAAGQQVYQTAIADLGIPETRRGVPTLVVADTVMLGAVEIPDLFPGLIEQGLAAGGVEWPAIRGIEAAADRFPDFAELAGRSASVLETIGRDPFGNSLAIVALAVMGYVALRVVPQLPFFRSAGRKERRAALRSEPSEERGWITPLLALAGLGVAGYLAFVEGSGNEAFCGPVGECNLVQESAYARLFGVIPVAYLGVLGFAGILIFWALTRLGTGTLADYGRVAALGVAALGTLFSLYLTFLEPFVIGATCIWCLASAGLMTALLWFLVDPGRAAWIRLR